ncbi:hypothetical protein JMJ77_0007424 [Colletotrichum scovillei]|uniref:Uncharacterized protein n=1 Tax=Colletotrichum scovillei TaxID=1209932 RepID=A0A9P7UFV9_9PEZI|nr:hypothetical protein JMJ77_0007424 [Colletotrichum scovillei]KAG7074398.1 hypothetical protein JMJ76_0010878 [Colletotrichum scovillei]KAG7081202.1 hypothetical protein JMJ78_0003328 [Colletotrichum scovillei]
MYGIMEDGGEEDELWIMAENIAKCQWQEPRLRNFPCHPMIHLSRLHPFFPFPRSQVPKSESVLPPPHPCLAAQASSLDATSFRAHQRGPPQGSPAPGATLSRHFDDDDDDHNHNHGLQLPPSPNLVRSLDSIRGLPSVTTTSPLAANFTSSTERHSAIFLEPAIIQLQPLQNHLRTARTCHHQVTSSRR